MDEKGKCLSACLWGLLTIFWGAPVCLLMLFAGLISCLFGLSLCLTVAEIVGTGWRSGIIWKEIFAELWVAGAGFALGATVAWLSSRLLAFVRRVYRERCQRRMARNIFAAMC
jgi:hypothetical protein